MLNYILVNFHHHLKKTNNLDQKKNYTSKYHAAANWEIYSYEI